MAAISNTTLLRRASDRLRGRPDPSGGARRHVAGCRARALGCIGSQRRTASLSSRDPRGPSKLSTRGTRLANSADHQWGRVRPSSEPSLAVAKPTASDVVRARARHPPDRPILLHVDVDGAPVIASCSHLAHNGTTPDDTGRHQTTQDDTWSQDPCLAAATLGSGARKGVGVRLSPLAPPLTCGSSVQARLGKR